MPDSKSGAMDLDALLWAMIDHNAGKPKRIQHLIKVHAFARLIAKAEGMDEDARLTLEAAAIVHDIGIKAAEEKYHSTSGHWQEIEGPPAARAVLERLGARQDRIERICYLVGHHHTYQHVQGLDYRILLEADFLVNLYEDAASQQAVQAAYETIFCTKTGRALCQNMFALKE